MKWNCKLPTVFVESTAKLDEGVTEGEDDNEGGRERNGGGERRERVARLHPGDGRCPAS